MFAVLLGLGPSIFVSQTDDQLQIAPTIRHLQNVLIKDNKVSS